MDVLVPFSTADPKSRLSDVLDADERAAFSRAMLADVIEAVRGTGEAPTVLATAPVEVGAPVVVDDRSLSTAVNAALDGAIGRADDTSHRDHDDAGADRDRDDAVAVVMADLALATPTALGRLFDADGDVAIAAGRGGGTNALVVRHPGFRVDYHGASYVDHLRIAAAAGASVREVDSHRLATDVDEASDLAEVLVHGDGEAAGWLRSAGFALDAGDGRVGVVRE
ncbi:2-phospho-L-lactate guanylyltransferase [Halorubrum sp. JWXQ-INN 858]|uniref:2-phospho-L-lactate guanylyltransferase n=1 Tax=Halorubrum sp. JWXQ-INN 858 TaxID=2690782 RepID=UPI00135AE7D3|nr:2-phospho-L-lactate guanylyltransferase [Halorubrum sp. JWXQ-INN 858]MWV64017.1 2-phospho-L-lactate guanylyltransferase [Halorubrum sp. JWXQ-INN 858]